MNTRYRLTFRGSRGGMYYCVDKTTGKRTSLQTANQDEAQQIIEAKNNSVRQPVLNLQIAKCGGAEPSKSDRTNRIRAASPTRGGEPRQHPPLRLRRQELIP